MAQLVIAMGVLAALLGPAAARGQAAPAADERFVAIGVMIVDGQPGLAWLLEPRLTQNRAIAVRQGQTIGPYQVTSIQNDRVELTGPNGPVWVPLLTSGGAVVASGGPVGASGGQDDGAGGPITAPAPARLRNRAADQAATPASAAAPVPGPRNPLNQSMEALKRQVEATAQRQREVAEAQRARLGRNPAAVPQPAQAPTPTAPAAPPAGTPAAGPRVSYPPQGSMMDLLAPR